MNCNIPYSTVYRYAVSPEYIAIFNPLRLRPLYIQSPHALAHTFPVETNQESTIELLKSAGVRDLDVESILSECYLFQNEQDISTHLSIPGKINTFQAMFIMVTGACNMACSYCLTKSNTADGPWSKSSLPKDKALRIVDFFIQNRKTDLPNSVIFYGGEPLLNWNLVEAIAEYVYNHNCYGKGLGEVSCRIITNGTLLNERILKRVKELEIDVVLSADGPSILNQKSRPFKQSNRSDEQLDFFSILKGMRKYDVEPVLSVTISPHNLPFIKEIVEWLKEANLSFMLSAVKESSIFETSTKFKEMVAEQIVEMYDYVVHNQLVEVRLAGILECIRNGQPYLNDCYAQGAEQIVVRPNGTIGACQGFIDDDTFFYPISIEELEAGGAEKAKPNVWRNRLAINMEPCRSCEALGVCGGGCPQQAAWRTGSLYEIDLEHCHQSKSLLSWLLKKVLFSEQLCESLNLPRPIIISSNNTSRDGRYAVMGKI